MFNIIKKTFFKKKSKQDPNLSPTEAYNKQNKTKFSNKVDKLYNFLAAAYNNFINEIKIIKDKLNNLSEANHQLGLRHLERGNLSDAIFRFRFINKIWPENQDAYYYLAYCLYLKKQNKMAREKLEELLQINPNYDLKAQELLKKINISPISSDNMPKP